MLTEKVGDLVNYKGVGLMENVGYLDTQGPTTVPHPGSPPDKQDDISSANYTGLEFSLGAGCYSRRERRVLCQPRQFLHPYCPEIKFVKQSVLHMCGFQSCCY